jgi:hypothetical protein
MENPDTTTIPPALAAKLRALESYQPKPVSDPSLRTSEPYLFEPIQVTSDLHRNGDISIEDLTDNDLDLPIDFA